jgi:hypothetical protein
MTGAVLAGAGVAEAADAGALLALVDGAWGEQAAHAAVMAMASNNCDGRDMARLRK